MELMLDDMVGEILQWLTPKSLGRFQSVSKKWRCMILEEISRRSSNEEKVLMITQSSIQSIDFSEPEIKAVTLVEFPGKENFYMGCAKGLVLYHDSENGALILLNPWTQVRQVIRTPYPKPLAPNNAYVYGFGYDKSNHSYAIVIMDRVKRDGFTWSSKTRDWVSFSCSLDFPFYRDLPFYGHVFFCSGVCVNGCMYWQTFSHRILCFDLKTCSFKVFERPPPIRRPASPNFTLIAFGDRLAATDFILGVCTDVWELNEQMQWIKIMAIPGYNPSPDVVVHYKRLLWARVRLSPRGFPWVRPCSHPGVFTELMVPVLRLKDGDLILVSKLVTSSRKKYIQLMHETGPVQGKLYLYNEKRKTFTTLKTHGIGGIGYCCKMVAYKSNCLPE